MFLYCLANFFQNFGPNVTTFVIPGEVFPTRYRSTGHGFSAACGKLGAIVAQVIFFKRADAIQTMYVSIKLCHCINDLSSMFPQPSDIWFRDAIRGRIYTTTSRNAGPIARGAV
jgi:hypothetical protein